MSPPPRHLPLLLAAAVAWMVGAPPVVAAASGWVLQWHFPDGHPPPFTRQELESAVSIRRPPADPGADVAVGWDAGGSGRIEASSQSRRRLVRLEEAQGPDAARLVALAVVDVLRPLPELSQLQAEPAAPAGPPAGALALLGALNRGATSAGFALEPALRVAWPLGRRWGVAGEVGYGQGRGRADGQTLVLHMIPVRLGLQLREGRWALNAGALARAYRTPALPGGAPPLWAALFGGHLALERSFALGRQAAALVAAGVDLQANAIDLRVRGRSLLRSGRVAPLVRVGLCWGIW